MPSATTEKTGHYGKVWQRWREGRAQSCCLERKPRSQQDPQVWQASRAVVLLFCWGYSTNDAMETIITKRIWIKMLSLTKRLTPMQTLIFLHLKRGDTSLAVTRADMPYSMVI